MKLRIVRRMEAALFGLALVGAALVAVLFVPEVTNTETVHLLNGTSSALTIRVGSSTTMVPADGRSSVVLPVGLEHIEVLAENKVVSDEWVEVPSSGGVTVYNALGAKAFCLSDVVYSSSKDKGEKAPEAKCFPGTTFWTHGAIDYVFTEPPNSMRMDGYGSRIVKSRLMEVPGGAMRSFAYLGLHGQPAELERLARTLPGVMDKPEFVQRLLGSLIHFKGGTSHGLAVAREQYRRSQESFELGWIYSSLAREAGLSEELNVELRERAATAPDTSKLHSLVAHNEDPAKAREIFLRLRAVTPDDSDLFDSLGVAFLRNGNDELAVKSFEHAREGNESDLHSSLWYATALVHLGRPAEAARELEEAIRETKDQELLIAYAALLRSAKLSTTAIPELVKGIQEEEQNSVSDWMLSVVPGVVEAGELKERDPFYEKGIRIQNAARRSPADAWRECHDADLNRAALYEPLRLALALEFARVGDTGLAAALANGLRDIPASFSSMQEYVRSGKSFREMVYLPPGTRAALHLVRARTLEASGQDASAEIAQLTADDVFAGPLTTLQRVWPHPTLVSQAE